MKKFYLLSILSIFVLIFVSCSGDEDDNGSAQGKPCSSNLDCQIGYSCDKSTGICTQGGGSGDSGDSGDYSDSGDSGQVSDTGDDSDTASDNPGKQDGDDDPITGPCTPGKKQTCPYQGDPATENVGPCRAGIRTCKEDGAWGKCEGEVLPVTEFGDELCNDGIDNDCDGTVDNGADFDGDGYGACSDCCEIASDCNGFDPATIYPGAYEMQGDEVDNNCNGEIDESTSCDGEDAELMLDDYPGNAIKLAHAMGICGDQLVSAEISLAGTPVTEQIADEQCVSVGSGSRGPRASLNMPYYKSDYQTFAATTQFGSHITPKEGSKIAVLSTGPWNAPTQEFHCAKLSSGDMKTASKVPEDWINMMKDCLIPKSPACNNNIPIETGLSNQCEGKEIPSVQDPIMLTLKVKAPMNARAFQFNLFFLSAEYPGTVCSDGAFNDFFFALLYSEHNNQYPDDEFQNPVDKNLAKDEKGNFVGIDLAPDGLFTVCDPNDSSNKYASYCSQGATLLEGTGFDGMTYGSGGTGWLTTRGNVVPGEIITLKLAIFEQGTVWTYGPDHSYDSTVLLDGFKWLPQPAKAGTGQY